MSKATITLEIDNVTEITFRRDIIDIKGDTPSGGWVLRGFEKKLITDFKYDGDLIDLTKKTET